MSEQPEKTGFVDTVLRAVAIIGLIAVLVLGAWGIIQLVVGLPDFFSSFGGSSTGSKTATEQVVISNPAIVTSDQPFDLTWSHKNSTGNYGYAISYACVDGLSFAAPVPTGQMQIVPCNTPFNFTSATSSLRLIPVLHTTKQVSTSFTITANRLTDGRITASSTSATVAVLPAAATTKPAAAPAVVKKPAKKPSTSTTRYVAATRTSSLYGSADLMVTIFTVTPGSNGRTSVQFAIQNIGTNVAASGWMFNAELPSTPSYTFASQAQRALYPGDKIVYTLGFDTPRTGYNYTNQYNTNCQQTQIYGYTNYLSPNYNCDYQNYDPYPTSPDYYGTNSTVTIVVDPQNRIFESNEANNSAGTRVSY